MNSSTRWRAARIGKRSSKLAAIDNIHHHHRQFVIIYSHTRKHVGLRVATIPYACVNWLIRIILIVLKSHIQYRAKRSRLNWADIYTVRVLVQTPVSEERMQRSCETSTCCHVTWIITSAAPSDECLNVTATLKKDLLRLMCVCYRWLSCIFFKWDN